MFSVASPSKPPNVIAFVTVPRQMNKMVDRDWMCSASQKSLAKNGSFLLTSRTRPPQNLKDRQSSQWLKLCLMSQLWKQKLYLICITWTKRKGTRALNEANTSQRVGKCFIVLQSWKTNTECFPQVVTFPLRQISSLGHQDHNLNDNALMRATVSPSSISITATLQLCFKNKNKEVKLDRNIHCIEIISSNKVTS